MKLWLVCFFALFFGVESIQWLSQLHWFSGVELSLPMVLVGGAGLVIASNYRYLQSLGLFPESTARPSHGALPETVAPLETLAPQVPSQHQADAGATTIGAQPAPIGPSSQATAVTQENATATITQPQTGKAGQVPVPPKSISFTIHKPSR
jgi:hypothetical protein